jgi:glucose-6-phosphate isomerase
MSAAGSNSLEVVATGAAADAVAAQVPMLVEERFASRLFGEDPTLWGPEAEAEASVRLSWVGLGRSSRPLVGQIAAIRDELAGQGVDRVVLCGMGGSSLAPEVICATAGVPLVVLDSSHPDQVRSALDEGPDRTVVVVSSKSGSTVETDSQKRAFEAAFEAAGIDPAQRIVVVTDPGSPLDQAARAAGYRVVNADPNVGGRYSALTAFGLVPSGLAGADVEQLLDEAELVADLLGADDDANPGLRLGAAMAGTQPLRDKLVLVEEGSGVDGLPAWTEQLIAESTGKQGTGVLPVVVAGPASPEATAPPADATVVHLVGDTDDDTGATTAESSVQVSGSLGAQLLLWEVATAVAGRLLKINPFDQPDVESAKKAARALLDAPPERSVSDFTDGPVSVQALGGDWLGDATTLADAVDRLLAQVDPDRGYLAVMAYLDRLEHAPLEETRESLAATLGRPVTFGWGPRFLHSTGQFHKGGPPVGVYLQVTDEPAADLPIAGRDFGFSTLVAAQAAGDAQVLADHGRPVLRVHLEDPAAGLGVLTSVLGSASSRRGS